MPPVFPEPHYRQEIVDIPVGLEITADVPTIMFLETITWPVEAQEATVTGPTLEGR